MADRAAFVDDSGETRLSGELFYPGSTADDVLTVQADGSIAAAPGSAFVPVAVKIDNAAATDIHAIGGHPVTWTHAVDPATGSPLAAIPAGLGLSIDLTGVSDEILPTADGTWSFTLLAVPSADATVKAAVFVTSAGVSVGFGPVAADDPFASFGVSGGGVCTGLTGVTPFGVAGGTTAAATANPCTLYCELLIVRLA